MKLNKRIITALVVILLSSSCRTLGNIKDEATLLLYGIEGKQLVFARNPCSGKPGEGYIISDWMSKRAIKKGIVVQCRNDCTHCRLTTR